jgi:hypothetical protein
MYPMILLAATVPAPPMIEAERQAILPDALRFELCKGMILTNMKTIERHAEMTKAFPQYCQSAWEFRQESVFKSWRYLYTAMDRAEPLAVRMRALERLRENIGDDAYYAGRLPCPIPAYGNWCPALVKE